MQWEAEEGERVGGNDWQATGAMAEGEKMVRVPLKEANESIGVTQVGRRDVEKEGQVVHEEERNGERTLNCRVGGGEEEECARRDMEAKHTGGGGGGQEGRGEGAG